MLSNIRACGNLTHCSGAICEDDLPSGGRASCFHCRGCWKDPRAGLVVSNLDESLASAANWTGLYWDLKLAHDSILPYHLGFVNHCCSYHLTVYITFCSKRQMDHEWKTFVIRALNPLEILFFPSESVSYSVYVIHCLLTIDKIHPSDKCTYLLLCILHSATCYGSNWNIIREINFIYRFFNVLLTVHLSITLVNNQLYAQFLYFVIRLLQSSTCFEQRRAHHQEVKLY